MKLSGLDGGDGHEIRFFDDAVNSARTVTAHDVVLPHAHPSVLVNHALSNGANIDGHSMLLGESAAQQAHDMGVPAGKGRFARRPVMGRSKEKRRARIDRKSTRL